MTNKNSAAKIIANNKYRAKTYDTITFAVAKGKKEMYINEANRLGYDSLTKFIVAAIQEKIERG